MCLRSAIPFLCLSLLVGMRSAGAQLPSDQTKGQNTPFTLHTSTRIVLTDVTVTDSAGRPIHGLAPSAFRILDNGHAQKLASFQEHTGYTAPDVVSVQPRNTFSNEYLESSPAVSTALLIDITVLSPLDQMYLAQQLRQFVAALPANTPVAIFARDGIVPNLLQDFTTDHDLLLQAVAKATPHNRQTEATFATDAQALNAMLEALKDVPGRKNVLWFSGGGSLTLQADASRLGFGENLRAVYDALEVERTAVYPIDARGLTVSHKFDESSQHAHMRELAAATGGTAFVNQNYLAEAAAKAVDNGGSFYTLTYSPQTLPFDNQWHRVKVEIDGGRYTLSYRRGYYADGTNVPEPPDGNRSRLRADGSAVPVPPNQSKPIIFRARVEPERPGTADTPTPITGAPPTPPAASNEVTYRIHFHVPAADFLGTNAAGKLQLVVHTGVLVSNRFGHPLAELSREVTLTPDQATIEAHPDRSVGFDQQINLPKGEDYLSIVIRNPGNGRTGRIQVPLEVKDATETACAGCLQQR